MGRIGKFILLKNWWCGEIKIGLIDVDGHKFPNIPLMKLSAWHKQKGDSVEWYQPLFSGHMDKVYMSKVFSFTPDYEYYIDADEVIKGGSGYCIELVDGKEIFHAERDQKLPPYIEHIYPDYSLYPELTKDTAYGFMSRGCPRGAISAMWHRKREENHIRSLTYRSFGTARRILYCLILIQSPVQIGKIFCNSLLILVHGLIFRKALTSGL